jgi:cytoskeleton protein RodZ
MQKTSQLLQQERERRGLSLQAVERELHIPLHYLEMLEGAGERRFLADLLYLIPALRNYATFLNLNPTVVVQQFTAEVQTSQDVASKALNPTQPLLVSQPAQRSPIWSRLAVLVFALGLLALIGHYGEMAVRWQWSPIGGVSSLPPSEIVSTLESPLPPAPSPPASPAPHQPEVSPDQFATSAVPPLDPPLAVATRQAEPPVPVPSPQPTSAAADSTSRPQEGFADAPHLLRVQAKAATWLRVTIDNQHAKEILLRPGQVVEWSAGEGFTLTLGNAGGVEVTLDGHGLPPFGKSGQVVRNIRLPLQG